MTASEFIILTGPPGAGKSTVARMLADSYERSVHLHADDFWAFIRAGMIAPYLPEADEQNHVVLRAVRDAALAYAEGGFTVIVDAVIGPWMLHHFRDASDSARLHYVVLRPSLEETLHRAQSRRAPALVDTDPLVSMWNNFADLGDLEPHAVDSTAQHPAETLAQTQAAIASGRFVL